MDFSRLESLIPRISQIISRAKGSQVDIVVQGEPTLRLPLEALPAGLEPDAQITVELWMQLVERSTYERLMARALRLLSVRERFRDELRRKLLQPPAAAVSRSPSLAANGQPEQNRRRSHARPSPDLVEQVLTRCSDLGYLDDERALKHVLDSALAEGSIGPLRLRQVLLQRACPGDLARSAALDYAQQFDEGRAAREILHRKRSSFVAKLERHWAKETAKVGSKGEIANPALIQRTVARQLGTAVVGFLAARGLTGESARREAREFCSALLGERAE